MFDVSEKTISIRVTAYNDDDMGRFLSDPWSPVKHGEAEGDCVLQHVNKARGHLATTTGINPAGMMYVQFTFATDYSVLPFKPENDDDERPTGKCNGWVFAMLGLQRLAASRDMLLEMNNDSYGNFK